MRHHAAHFGDESTGGHEERSPGGVSAGADEDFSRYQMYTARVMHYMDDPFCDTRRNRTACDHIVGIRLCADTLVKRASVADRRATEPSPWLHLSMSS